MPNSQKEFLFQFGWDNFFENQISNPIFSSLLPARVICEERNLYHVQTGFDQTFLASVSGKMLFNAVSRIDYPAVGDWVLVEQPFGSDRAVIHRILDRKTILHRKQVGSSGDRQILSTNVDFVFITTSVNSDLNYRRIERYLTVAKEFGVMPIILLTKSDTYPGDIGGVVSKLQKEFPQVQVQSISKETFADADFLATYLKPGTTSVFIGSSGVGKSTLVNYLIESHEKSDVIKTQEVRESDGKGRHTTTSRNLYVCRFGGLIIDTPGMREIQLADHSDGLCAQFSDVEKIIQQCKFSDCYHQTEPGCELLKALDAGVLSLERWQSYQKLKAEVQHGLRKLDKIKLSEDRKLWKKRSIESRNKSRLKVGVFR